MIKWIVSKTSTYNDGLESGRFYGMSAKYVECRFSWIEDKFSNRFIVMWHDIMKMIWDEGFHDGWNEVIDRGLQHPKLSKN